MSASLSRLSTRLHEILGAAGRSAALTDAAHAAIALTASTEISPLLDDVLEDGARLAACARLSYTHALGFDKFVLIDADPVFTLRLHVWWPDRPRIMEHVHNHRFGVAGVILSGGYDMQLFCPADEGEPVAEYVERASLASSDWRLERVGPARLRMQTTWRLREASSYALEAQTLHRIVVPAGAACVTLFLETATVRATTRVFTPPDGVEQKERRKVPFSADEYRGGLRGVQHVLLS